MNTKIPEGYSAVIPYLIIKNAADFINFTEKVFNATLLNKHLRDETTIMHAEIKIDDSIIMFADSTSDYPPASSGFFIYVNDVDSTYKTAIENGAKELTKIADQPYGRSGGVQDPFGNSWWITSVI